MAENASGSDTAEAIRVRFCWLQTRLMTVAALSLKTKIKGTPNEAHVIEEPCINRYRSGHPLADEEVA